MVSPHCRAVLQEPMTKELAYDFKRIRARVMCRAWQAMETERIPFRVAISRAWEDIRREARQIGASV